MYQEQEIDPRLLKWFDAFEGIPPIDERRNAVQRANFLDQAQKMMPAVSKSPLWRQNGWKLPIKLIIPTNKEHQPMFQILASIILVITLVLGAGGITTFAAQASLPDGPLYGLKIWSEGARLSLADPDQNWQLALEFAERRASEIRLMVMNEQIPPEALQIRLQEQVEQAMRMAIGKPDEEARAALEQVRKRLETQARMMENLRGSHDPQAEAALTRAREMLQERLHWAESGIQEPAWLREQFRLQQQGGQTEPGGQERWRYGTAQPGGVDQPGAGPCLNCTPQGQQSGGNPWTTGTPTPGSGYGEGWGGNPWTTGTPTPGSGYGPGPGPEPVNTCTPQARNGSGVKPTDPPAKEAGPKPTDPPGYGPGPKPTQEDVDGGSQPGQGGAGPQEPSPPKNGGKP